MRFYPRCFSLALSSLVLSHAMATAATLVTSPAALTSANLLVQFEVFPDGTPVPVNSANLSDQWRSLGLIIADDSPQNGASAYTGVNDALPHSGVRALGPSGPGSSGGFIEFRFVIPNTSNFGVVEEVGLWVQNGDFGFGPAPPQPSTVTFFDTNGAVLGAVTTSTARENTDQFVGIQAPEGVALIRIADNLDFTVDDIQFSPVPESASGGLLLSAAGGLLAKRRRGRASTST